MAFKEEREPEREGSTSGRNERFKDLREVRMAKMRSGVDVLDAAATGGGGVALTGVGSMELGEDRGFITGVVDGLRYV